MGRNSVNDNLNTTKLNILECAANLFALKGYTETTMRELSSAAKLKNPASLYYHFPSKNAVLEYMLEEYAQNNTDILESRNIGDILRKSPNTDGVIACLQTSFPIERLQYYLNVLCVMLQEQLRNATVRKYISDNMILSTELSAGKIFSILIEIGVIRNDIDIDYWKKIISSLFYTFASRRMLGIGDNSPEFIGKGMEEMLRGTFDMIFKLHGTAEM